MATLTRYVCPVDDNCPESEDRGFCPVHHCQLELRRDVVLSTDDGGGRAADDQDEAEAPSSLAPGSSDPSLAVIVAKVLLPIEPEGGSPTRLGRDAPLWLVNPALKNLGQVSRWHAELSWREGRLYLSDTGSTNGTYVDGRRVTAPVQVWPGRHTLRFGEDVDVVLTETDEDGAPRASRDEEM